MRVTEIEYDNLIDSKNGEKVKIKIDIPFEEFNRFKEGMDRIRSFGHEDGEQFKKMIGIK